MATPQSTDSAVQIQLTRGQLTYVDVVDADLAARKWQYSSRYASRAEWRDTHGRSTKRNNRRVLMHRVIMERVLGRRMRVTEHVDHANGDPLDNRRANLRLATHSQNIANAKHRCNSTSPYKGASLHKASGLWQAYIHVAGRKLSLGYFRTPEDAHQAYRAAAIQHFGPFARFE